MPLVDVALPLLVLIGELSEFLVRGRLSMVRSRNLPGTADLESWASSLARRPALTRT